MDGKKLMEFVKQYWPVLIFIGSLFVTWQNFLATNRDFEKRISVMESKVQSYDPLFLKIQTDLAEIKTTLEFLKNKP